MKKRKWERMLAAVLLLMVGVLPGGCQGKTQISAETTTAKQEESLKESQETSGLELIIKETEEENKVDWTEEIFTGENVFISYPVFSFQESECADSINQKIQEDALRILEYFDVNLESDTLDITYEIADITKDWISIVYYGSYSRADAAYPTAVKYTSNLSLKDGTHIRIAQMESAEELAEKIVKGNYRVIGEEEELNQAVREYVAGMEKEAFVRGLESADFGMESYEAYPEWFSFWSTIEGETQISIVMPVIHALGDYAVLELFSEEK